MINIDDKVALLGVKKAEELFINDETKTVELWRRISMRWHPDRPGGVVDVFTHVKELYEQALIKIAADTWGKAGKITIEIVSPTETAYEVKYHTKHELDVGMMYVGDSLVTFVLDSDNVDLGQKAERQLKSFKFPDAHFKSGMKPYLPVCKVHGITRAGQYMMVLEKQPREMLLRDMLTYFGGKIEPKHAAWIVSRMYNIACYFQITGLSHGDISPDTLFIDAEDHKARIVGGWWYSTQLNSKLKVMSGRTADIIPASIMKSKIATLQLDGELIRATGREILGDITGGKLLMDKNIPKPMVTWLLSPSSTDLVADFTSWQKALKDSYGARRFTVLALSPSDIY